MVHWPHAHVHDFERAGFDAHHRLRVLAHLLPLPPLNISRRHRSLMARLVLLSRLALIGSIWKIATGDPIDGCLFYERTYSFVPA